MINQLFILGTIVLIIMIINISLHSTIKTLNGNVLAIGIAIIEIAVAAAVWLKYRGDQKKRKTYQIKGLLKTLCVIHSIVFRLYDYKFINTDSTKYEEKKLMLEKNILIMENQVRVSGDLLTMIEQQEVISLDSDLRPKFLHECLKNEYEFKMYSYPFVLIVSNIIKRLDGETYDENSILKPIM